MADPIKIYIQRQELKNTLSIIEEKITERCEYYETMAINAGRNPEEDMDWVRTDMIQESIGDIQHLLDTDDRFSLRSLSILTAALHTLIIMVEPGIDLTQG